MKREVSEVNEVSKEGQYHSALHESDNRYHIHSDCPQGSNIEKRCYCDESPVKLCQWCGQRSA